MPLFSPRQREVLLQVAEGLTLQEIALQLGVHESTVKTHYDEAKNKIPLIKGKRNRVLIANWVKTNLR